MGLCTRDGPAARGVGDGEGRGLEDCLPNTGVVCVVCVYVCSVWWVCVVCVWGGCWQTALGWA